MTKEYQYQFNETVFREKMKLLVDLNLKHGKSKAGTYMTFVGLCLTFGIGFLFLDSSGTGLYLGPLLIVVGLIYLSAFIHYLVKIKKFREAFDKELQGEVDRLNSISGNITIMFSNEDFYYSDGDHETRLKWKLFKSYLLFDSHLFLVLNNSDLSGYTLSAFDLTNSDFSEISTFIETKLEPHYLSPKKEEKQDSGYEILDN